MTPESRIQVRPKPRPGPDSDSPRFQRRTRIFTVTLPSRLAVRRAFDRRRDRGSLALEVAILFPLVLTLTFGAVQVGMWFEARSMCQAAAEAGVRAGKVLHAPAGAGAAAARSYLTDVSNGLVVSPIVNEART